jgi:peptide/nickel transport system permease protein
VSGVDLTAHSGPLDNARGWQTTLGDRWYYLARDPTTLLGLAILLVLLFAAVFGPYLTVYEPTKVDASAASQPPSLDHLFGTDQFGYDVFTRVVHAARIDLTIAATAVAISAAIGTFIGALAAFAPRLLDELFMRSMDVVQAFPRFIFAMAIVFALGPGVFSVVVATAAINIPGYARLMRTSMLSAKSRRYAMAAVGIAAVGIGNPWYRVLFRHLAPNGINPIMVQATLHSGWAILEAAGLSFIGLGVRVPEAEWGVMISMGLQELLQGHWWTYTFPGLAIGIAVLGFNLLGDGLQRLLDPRAR